MRIMNKRIIHSSTSGGHFELSSVRFPSIPRLCPQTPQNCNIIVTRVQESEITETTLQIKLLTPRRDLWTLKNHLAFTSSQLSTFIFNATKARQT